MGAWGANSFENDEALDWVFELEASASVDVVRQALAIADREYVEAPDGSMALAAAEVVAAALGCPPNSLPESVSEWVASHGAGLTEADAAIALAAVARVRSKDSELRELWDETDAAEWLAAVDELRQRLNEAIP